MRIAVDARFLQVDDEPELSAFTKEVFERLSIQNQAHDFIFFTDKKLNCESGLSKNVTLIVLTPQPTHLLAYKWWYDVKLAFALKKHRADVFIATYGLGSLTTSVKQILIVRDLAFLHKPFFVSSSSHSFYKRNTDRFIKKSAAIVTLSNFVREELLSHYPKCNKNIHPIFSGTSYSFQPVEWEEREAIKEQFSNSCEYFFFTLKSDTKSNFLNVLKAFSNFKKWQKTNMKLMVAGTFGSVFKKDLEKLDSYKYRSDIIIKNNISEAELSKLIAASYATIYPSFYDGFAMPALHALYCEVPLIASVDGSTNDIAADAALYSDPSKPEDISAQMKRIFKDEQLRNKLIETARQRKKMFTWDITAELLWKVVEDVVSQ